MQIVDLERTDSEKIAQVAEILRESFHGHCPDYDDPDDALKKVMEAFDDHQISRVALDRDGAVIGWIGGIKQYNGKVLEIDPLVVRKNSQEGGVGTALVRDFERIASQWGAQTIWLGTDDEDGRTSLSDVDLYPDPWTHIKAMKNDGRHPVGFYQKLGFVIVGVLPDANGFGKPDIYMAKRVNCDQPDA